MALAEMKMKEDTFAPTSETDFLSEIEDMLNGDEDDDDYDYDDYDLDIEFKKAPNEASYNDVLDIMKSYEDESVLNDFKAEFSEGEPVKKKDYSRFAMTLIDDMSEVSFIQANWISMFDEEVYDKAGLNEAEEEVAVDDTEVAADGEENIDVDTTTEVDPNVKAVQDALTQAQAAAQKLGDPKLTDQIGNTITFFTRAHVVEKGAVAEGDLMKNIGKGLEYEATEEMIRDYADRLLGAGVDDVEDLANYYLSNPEELPEPMKYEFFKNNYDDILSVAMTGLGEGKKENKKEKDIAKDLNEAMFPLLKRILK
jgi:hypothetical protein